MGSSKKDFTKDYIFNLIMPSDPIGDLEEPKQGSTPVPQQEQAVDEQDSLSVLKSRLKQASAPSVPLRPAKEFVLVNLMEQLVVDRLDEVFAKFNCCRCDKCKRDVTALALNSLQPQYVVAAPDDLPDLLKSCSSKEVASALIKAIIQVKHHPQH